MAIDWFCSARVHREMEGESMKYEQLCCLKKLFMRPWITPDRSLVFRYSVDREENKTLFRKKGVSWRGPTGTLHGLCHIQQMEYIKHRWDKNREAQSYILCRCYVSIALLLFFFPLCDVYHTYKIGKPQCTPYAVYIWSTMYGLNKNWIFHITHKQQYVTLLNTF